MILATNESKSRKCKYKAVLVSAGLREQVLAAGITTPPKGLYHEIHSLNYDINRHVLGLVN